MGADKARLRRARPYLSSPSQRSSGLFSKLICRAVKKPDEGGESAAAMTPTAVVGFASFGLTLTARLGRRFAKRTGSAMNGSNRVLGIAQPVGIREANGFGNEWKPGGLPEPNPTEPAGETGFAAHPVCGLPEPNPDRARRREASSRLPPLVRAGKVGCRLAKSKKRRKKRSG